MTAGTKRKLHDAGEVTPPIDEKPSRLRVGEATEKLPDMTTLFGDVAPVDGLTDGLTNGDDGPSDEFDIFEQLVVEPPHKLYDPSKEQEQYTQEMNTMIRCIHDKPICKQHWLETLLLEFSQRILLDRKFEDGVPLHVLSLPRFLQYVLHKEGYDVHGLGFETPIC